MTRKKVTNTTKYVQAPIVGSMALWMMCPFGVLMPAAVPAETAHKLGLTDDTLQVRTREAATLDKFRQLYAPTLGPNVATPSLDYDFRSYITRADLARATAAMVLDVDAPKFKPLVDGPLGLADVGKASALHDAYLKVWGVVCALGTPKQWSGGKGDPRSESSECNQWGHLWPPTNARKRVRAVACQDHKCHAIKDTASGVVRYPARSKVSS